MFHVYVIVSEFQQDRYYIGFSAGPRERLAEHNAGKNPSTCAFVPWKFAAIFSFLRKIVPDTLNVISRADQEGLFSGGTFSSSPQVDAINNACARPAIFSRSADRQGRRTEGKNL